jgi:hypothetical protein
MAVKLRLFYRRDLRRTDSDLKNSESPPVLWSWKYRPHMALETPKQPSCPAQMFE